MSEWTPPERIWVWDADLKEENLTAGWNSSGPIEQPYGSDLLYLLATPEREAAPELAEALGTAKAQLWIAGMAALNPDSPEHTGRFSWTEAQGALRMINSALSKARGEAS